MALAMRKTEPDRAEVRTSNEALFKITSARLPLHCPLPEMSLWNQHPRVYLPIEASGRKNALIAAPSLSLRNKPLLFLSAPETHLASHRFTDTARA